jgi:hypothetical protein
MMHSLIKPGRSRAALFLLFATFFTFPLFLGFQAWEKPIQPDVQNLQTVLPHPLDSKKIIAASTSQIFEGDAEGKWKKIWNLQSTKPNIRRLAYFPELPDRLFVLTSDGAFSGNFKDKSWKQIYGGLSLTEKEVFSIAVLHHEPGHWFIGTGNGLFESDDFGRTWFRFSQFKRQPIFVLRFLNNKLFLATGRHLYVSEDLSHFHRVFSLSQGRGDEEIEGQEFVDEEAVTYAQSDFQEVLGFQKKIWLATEEGVFQSVDRGEQWNPLTTIGLRTTRIEHLAYSEKTGQLFAGSSKGVYVYRHSQWEELFQGLDATQVLGLSLVQGDKEILFAMTPHGLYQYPLLPDGIQNASMDIKIPENMNLFKQLISREPSVQELHRAVIHYTNLKNSKTKRWQIASRISSLLPNLSFGKDFSQTNNVDIDRGSTTDRDQFIFGPDDIDRDWSFDVGWDLGDLIWSSNQTSIDSREKLMVELRNDVVAEATRIYYERRRLQMDLLLNPSSDPQDHYERLLRIEELTSLLDGMSGGFFSGRLSQLYISNPEMKSIWDFRAQGTGAQGTS